MVVVTSVEIVFVTVVVDVWALFAMITGRMFRLDGIARIALRLQVSWIVAGAFLRWTALGVQAVVDLFRPTTESSDP